MRVPIFLGKGVFGGLVSGRFPEKARERGVFAIANGIYTRHRGYIFFPRWGGGEGSGDGERAYRYPLIIWGGGGLPLQQFSLCCMTNIVNGLM